MKRATDLILSLIALLILSPVILITGILIWRKLGSPIIFMQKRPGKSGLPFNMIKFRSMTDEKDSSGKLLPNEQRLTPFGVWLRATSLDELPELINVIKGDMSLVGPRPLLMDYLPYYTVEQDKRHQVKPGITGWAQVNGRNTLSWDQKISYDVWYVEHQSLFLDIKILLLTILKVFRKEGITPKSRSFTVRFDDYMKQKRK